MKYHHYTRINKNVLLIILFVISVQASKLVQTSSNSTNGPLHQKTSHSLWLAQSTSYMMFSILTCLQSNLWFRPSLPVTCRFSGCPRTCFCHWKSASPVSWLVGHRRFHGSPVLVNWVAFRLRPVPACCSPVNWPAFCPQQRSFILLHSGSWGPVRTSLPLAFSSSIKKTVMESLLLSEISPSPHLHATEKFD